MANIAQSTVMVAPSFIEPGLILPYTQVSGAFDALAGRQPMARLNDGDLYAYMKRIDLRTAASAGQSAYNQIRSISTMLSMISTPTYLMRVRSEWDHHDAAAHARWGVNIVELNRLGMRQAHFQLARSALLYGFNPGKGEGLLNAQGATAVTLPADSNGNTTVATYDNGQMAIFFLSQLQALKTTTNQLGQGVRFVILGPQRVLGYLTYAGIVQVTQFQRPGGGTAVIAEVVTATAGMNNDQIEWVYDDTLQGKGAGGADAVLIVMPEVRKPAGNSPLSTNEFAKLEPGILANVLMYCDTAAPTEIPTPMPGGGTDNLTEWRISSGWVIRPEGIRIISIFP